MTTPESDLSIQYTSTEESPIKKGDRLEIPFDFRNSKQIVVKENGEILKEGPDYEVVIGLPTKDKKPSYTYKKIYGYVKIQKAVAQDNVIMICRDTAITQEAIFDNGKKLNQKRIEEALDKLTMIDQEQEMKRTNATKDLTQAQENIEKLFENTSGIEKSIGSMLTDISSNTSAISNVNTKLSSIENRVTPLEEDNTSIKTRLSAVESTESDTRDRVTALEKKTPKFENDLNAALGKLENIEDNAQENVIESIVINGETSKITNKTAEIDIDKIYKQGMGISIKKNTISIDETVALKSDIPIVPTDLSAFNNDVGYLTQHQDISGKQDLITDIDAIRSGAAKGETAIQEESDPIYIADKPNIALKSDIPDLTGKADKATTLAGYGITDAYTKTEVDAKVSSVYKFKGNVDTYFDLPSSNNTIGDTYNVTETGANYSWTGTDWDKLSETVDLTPYALKTDIPDISSKQDTLISGINIKTINGTSILGEGNVTIQGGGSGVSNYADLSDKPSINGEELIGNKTTEQLHLFDGDYQKLTNKPTDLSEFNNDVGYLTQHQNISGKEDKSNKVTSIDWASVSADTYPSTLAVSSAKTELLGYVDQKVATKQDIGDYALKSELPDTSSFATKNEIKGFATEESVNACVKKDDLYTREGKESPYKTKINTNISCSNDSVTVTSTKTFEEGTHTITYMSKPSADKSTIGTRDKSIPCDYVIVEGRLYFLQSSITFYQYTLVSDSGTWTEVSGTSAGGGAAVGINNGRLYMLQSTNVTPIGTDTTWQRVSGSISSTDKALGINNGKLYTITYNNATLLDDTYTWEEIVGTSTSGLGIDNAKALHYINANGTGYVSSSDSGFEGGKDPDSDLDFGGDSGSSEESIIPNNWTQISSTPSTSYYSYGICDNKLWAILNGKVSVVTTSDGVEVINAIDVTGYSSGNQSSGICAYAIAGNNELYIISGEHAKKIIVSGVSNWKSLAGYSDKSKTTSSGSVTMASTTYAFACCDSGLYRLALDVYTATDLNPTLLDNTYAYNEIYPVSGYQTNTSRLIFAKTGTTEVDKVVVAGYGYSFTNGFSTRVLSWFSENNSFVDIDTYSLNITGTLQSGDVITIATTEAKHLIINVPVGTIVQSPYDISGWEYMPCNGAGYNIGSFPNLESLTPKPITYYRLRNNSRGNSYWNSLWTTDPDITRKRNPDLSTLFRTTHNSDVYNTGLVPIQENIEMHNGTIVSESGFYDGTYSVSTSYTYSSDKGLNSSEMMFNKYVDKFEYPYVSTVNNQAGYSFIKLQNMYLADDKYGTISDNGWLTNVTDGQYINFGTQSADGTWAKRFITNKSMNSFNLIFEFITPSTFVAGSRDIFYAFRGLVIRTSDVSGSLHFYMAAYKSSGVKWHHNNIDTGIDLSPNTKYKINFYKSTYGTTAPFHYNIDVSKWSADSTLFGHYSNAGTYEFTSKYYPYNYYNSTGLGTIYCADATTWTEGLFLDLSSISATMTATSYGTNEYTSTMLGYIASDSTLGNKVYLPNLSKDHYIKVV